MEIDTKLKIPIDFLLNTNQLTEFDDNFTSYLLGFDGADDYYRNVSSVYQIKKVNVPLLCINSQDDQISFKESIPYQDINKNENVALIVTSHGTHSCFIESKNVFGVKQWVPKPAIEFLKAIPIKN